MSPIAVDPVPAVDAPGGVAVRCDNVVKVFGTPGAEVTALRGVDLVAHDGEMVALLGPSGSGKSTLLWLLAGLMSPTAGTVEVCGQRTSDLSVRTAADFRLRQVGVVLQNPSRNLLSYDSALGNLAFAQRPSRRSSYLKRRRAHELLEAVGLEAVARHRAGRLSGGEQQRLAVAVALVNGPRLLLADEPTSQLDAVSAASVVDLLRATNADSGTTVIAVTHDPDIGSTLGRTVTIRDGRVGAEGRAGEEYLVIGRDGTVHLPIDTLDVLPPGSLARATRTKHGVELRPVTSRDDPETRRG